MLSSRLARIARIIVPDLPHHVTQRRNRRQKLFVEDGDYALYRDLLAERCAANGVTCWAYCLMPNHVHLILTPSSEAGLSCAAGETHRRYAAFVNARARVTDHLFQGRFACAARLAKKAAGRSGRFPMLRYLSRVRSCTGRHWPTGSSP